MTAVVISQPMLFPWPGMFEQITLADVYVHHDDAQFSLSSFTRRIQVKTGDKITWMTIPLADKKNMYQKINALRASDLPWIADHRNLLKRSLRGAPFLQDALDLFDAVHSRETVCDKLMASVEDVCRYLGIGRNMIVSKTSDLGIGERSWRRVLDVVHHYKGTRYLTGHGAANYMDHATFEAEGVAVEYMDYSKTPWPQFGTPFTPYVTILDLIAHAGPQAVDYLHPATMGWRDFMALKGLAS